MEASEASDYFVAFDALAGTYLEDSWVLDVSASERDCTFRLDLVLTPQHPGYHQPRPGEQYCYARALLRVTSGVAVAFQPGTGPPASDATGEFDWGNIDTFDSVDWEGRDAWQLTGSWGELLAAEPEVSVEFLT